MTSAFDVEFDFAGTPAAGLNAVREYYSGTEKEKVTMLVKRNFKCSICY